MINAIPEPKKSHTTLLISLRGGAAAAAAGLAAGAAAGWGAPLATSMRTLTPAKTIVIMSMFLVSFSV